MAEDTQPKKRRIRASTETVRQRTEKLQERETRATSPTRHQGLRAFWRGFLWPARQIARPFRWLGRFRVVRFLGRILLPRYFRGSWRELRQVTWPDRRTSWRLTYAVIIFSLIFGVIIFIVDFGLDKLFKEFIIK
jgi:preprotein translocase SecE subunit